MDVNNITITLKDAAELIAACPDVRFFLRGEPGIGKSSIMATLKARFGDAYAYAYFDCAQKDLGDIAVPAPNRELRITEYFPNAALQLQSGKPVVIMLDEYSKAPQPVQNMLHPLLEVHNPRLGDVALPEGSIVVLTGNLASDGVGDNVKAHTLNRVTVVTVRKPTAKEWLEWATDAGIDPVVLAWADRFPQAFESYMDATEANPYIYNPKVMQSAYVSPRSLELVNRIVSRRDKLSDDALLAAMAGTIGASAAHDMLAFVRYQDELPTWGEIVNDPKGTTLPTSPGATAVLVFSMVTRVDEDTLTPVMHYIQRLPAEWQATFAIHLFNSRKQDIAVRNRAFSEFFAANADLF